jgi:DNA polymerase (family X)
MDLKGIGKGLGSAIIQAVDEGRWADDWLALHDETPAGLIEMLAIPGLGPKRIKMLYEELGVDSVAALKSACEAGDVAPLKGLGEKSQQRMSDGIELLSRFRARRRLNVGLAYGEAFESRISQIDGVIKAQLAGSTRRRKETIGDLDLVVSALPVNHEMVSKAILSLPGIADVKGAGDSKISLILEASLFDEEFSLGNIDDNVLDAIGGADYQQLEASGTIDAQIRLVPPEVFAFTLAYFTGSKEHNVRLRQRAIDRGLKLNEFGLIPTDLAGELKGMEAAKFSLPAQTEADIYRHLEMDYVVPELREDMGEMEVQKLPELLELKDVKGSLHNHTTLSDGEATLEEMVAAARKLGWEWLGIADHSQSLKIAHGLEAEDLLKQGNVIKSYNDEFADFTIIHGTESDVLEGGKLDYSDDVLSSLDYVVASVHAIPKWKNRDESTNTEELIRVMEHPSATVLGHPTGRILQGRDGYEVDMNAVLQAMSEMEGSKIVELNASPYRLDLDWRLCKRAKELGVPVSINPDAHDLRGLTDIRYGVDIARKGWLEAEDVLNSLSADDLLQQLAN